MERELPDLPMEKTPEQAQSKFQLTETLLPPAKCISCSRARQEPMVSPNLYIEFYGQVYLCVFCAQEIAVAVQYGPVAELHVAQAEVVARNEEIAELQAKLEEERENVRVLTRLAASGDNSSDSGSDSSSDSNPMVSEPVETAPEKPKPRPRAGKVVSPKSSNGSSESSSS